MLRAHQVAGAKWLAERARAYLGDAPRVGKTRTILQALYNRRVERALVVCPAIVRDHWHREADAMGVTLADVKSYDAIVNGGVALMRHLILDKGVDALVIDEAHACKNPTTRRSKLLLGRDGYARRLGTVYAASGTPVPKHAGDLWTIVSAMFPEVAIEHGIHTHQEWLDRFCVEASWAPTVYARDRRMLSGVVKNEAELRVILSKIMLRRTLDDLGTDVPPVDWQVTRLAVGEGELLYDDMDLGTLKMAAAYKGALADIAMEPAIMRMRRRLGELKAPLVASLLKGELAESNEKIVVFAHHTAVIETLREELREFGVMCVIGQTARNERVKRMDRFQSDPTARVFLGQNIACKEGITLHAAARVVIVEPDWTAVVNEQLGNRVLDTSRPGRHCVAEMIALSGTLDEAIVGQNAREVRMLTKVLA